MRNALLISSLLFIAVSCKREDDRATRDRTAMEDTTGSRVGTGNTGASDQTGPGPGYPTGTTGDMDRPGAGGTAPPSGTAGTGTTGDMAQPGGTAGTAPPSGTAGTGTTGDMGQPGAGGTAPPPSGTAGTQPPGGTTGDMGQPGAGGAAPPSGTAGTGGMAPSMAAMTCDQLIPSTIRDQYLRDATITSTGGVGGNVANCRAEGGDLTSAVNITADCATTGARSASEIRRQNPSGRAIENVGKAAVLTETGSTKQLTALDDDSNCRIDVSVPQNVDAVAIGRAMLDKLPGKG